MHLDCGVFSFSLQTLRGGMWDPVRWPGREAGPLTGSEEPEPLDHREAPDISSILDPVGGATEQTS